MQDQQLTHFLNQKLSEYNQPRFIPDDPICIPHRFSLPADIEIAGFFSALFAWGNRITIIAKGAELMQRMDNAPHQFVLHHGRKDIAQLLGFKHRTFTEDDLLYFVHFLQQHYQQHTSLEAAFLPHNFVQPFSVEQSLNLFKQRFFSYEHLPRTRKHISAPVQNSACKRLNMFLRWMVRSDNLGVDFGIWKQIKPHQLICPLDVHVARVATRFGLLSRPNADWKAAVELTQNLKQLDANDPVKYDFALFALGVVEKF